MAILKRVKSILQSLFRKEELDRDLDDELQSYLDLVTKEKMGKGMSPGEARRQARVELGGVEQVKESVREVRLGAGLETVFQDVRYGLRSLRKNAGFTLVAVLILAIGIGANTALFSTINTVLLRHIPFAEPERLVAGRKTRDGQMSGPVSRVDFFDYRELSRSFEDLAALGDFTTEQTITGGEEPELVQTGYVTWNLFPTLGVNPVAGRGFLPEEETQGGAASIIISYGLWQSRLGGSAEALGSTLNLDGSPYTVVGVMPRGFRFLFDVDLWRLVDRDGPFDPTRDSHSGLVVGRLKAGVSLEQAQSDIDSISRGLEQQYPDTNRGKGLLLADLQGYMVSNVRSSLLLLLATTVLLLAIACGNVAGLLLARGQRRVPEMAMRAALGAPRGRLIRQLLTESVILTVVAGIAGVALAVSFQELLLRLLPIGRVGIDRPAIDEGALLFALAVSVATGLVVGVVPALRGTALSPSRHLKAGTRTSEAAQSARLRAGLVVLQVAVSIVLLIGSGLLGRSLARLATVDLGFDPENVLTGRVRIQEGDYPTPVERSQFFTSLVEEIEALPGVVSATVASKMPILNPWQDWPVWHAEEPRPSSQDSTFAMARWVAPKYFETMRIPLLEGRDILETDVPDGPQVVVLSEMLVRVLFPDQDPLGRMVKIGWSDVPYEVVGVVGDARLNTLAGGLARAMYMSSAQAGFTAMQIAVRSSGDPNLLTAPIHRILRAKDPNIVFAAPATMASIIGSGLSDFRIVMMSVGLFSGIALALTAIGLYGVLAYHVSQRTNEIGIRLAVGASQATLLGMILRRGLALVGVGLALGVGAAFPVTLLIRQLLFETEPLDPATYVGSVFFLALVAGAASLLPAWRASRLNLVDVLRSE